ncbi:Eco57I restriction-modification methylase domain-containing protein [Candidatus Viridilinea mediisalina]|uniref:Eco57I restriction-modification methylase domain-containing protein n=1 Tax=Candidatus Viridilinea mediisalina TaxID=2024553 RepID=UPI00157F8D94|nr:DNA methyltransferase [Candidatus Viridilinea mediisalina]
MAIDVNEARSRLQAFAFADLFIEDLGWFRPVNPNPETWDCQGITVTRRELANLSGVVVFEITTADGAIPDEPVRRAIHRDIAQLHLENLLIFLNAERRSSLWYWVKRDGSKRYPRRHAYVQGQPGELLIAKLSAMFVDISELDAEGNLPLLEAARRVRQALDVEPVTKRFFNDFQKLHTTLLGAIAGVADERERHWYASVLLSRLMFVYFLQRRGFLDGGNYRYLQQGLEASEQRGQDRYFSEFLTTLFFEGFAKPEADRSAAATALIGSICYLNGGLFLPHQVEQKYPRLAVSDQVLRKILELFESYDWVLDDTPSGNERAINPAVLGYIFEKYINQKSFGAYYTRSEITAYLCEQTIHRLVLDRVNQMMRDEGGGMSANSHPSSLIPHPSSLIPHPYETVGDLLLKPTDKVCRMLLLQILPDLRLLDPACGSGAFLVAAMRTLIEIYSALVGKAKFMGDTTLDAWLAEIERDHPNLDYYIKKQIIVNNLYGVDIMAEAVEIARLRLFLALVASARTVNDLEPLPNIDFNILAGNALIGLLRIDEERAEQKAAQQQTIQQIGLFEAGKRQSYRQAVKEKNRLVTTYRDTATTLRGVALSALRDEIQRHREEAAEVLDALLLDDFQSLGIKYEEATWDTAKGKLGKPKKRPLTLEDLRALQPFHWGYEFDEVMNERGGFDAIIANPPWETLKPDAKEFFGEHSDLVSKKKMNVKAFEQEQTKLLQDPEILGAWLSYLSRFPYQSAYFRTAAQFDHQSAVVGGKRTGTDINFYKLFVEQIFHLLHPGGQGGIVVPSGIYTDLGATGLRKLLFDQTQVRAILSLSNERYLFEGIHHAFRYVFLTFEKGGLTNQFEAAFRINPREAVGINEIDSFLNTPDQHLTISLDVVRQLSPETLSVMEFRSPLDVTIAQKLLRFPTLGSRQSNAWNLVLTNEFHMSNDSRLFQTHPLPTRLPLYEGKMMHQFFHLRAEPKYWIEEQVGRAALLGRTPDDGQQLDYQQYRLAFREIAPNTNERSMIATMLPQRVFANHKLMLSDRRRSTISNAELLFCCAVLNSFVLDYTVRQRIVTSISMFIFYQLPVPRLTAADPRFAPIVERAAKLICTTPEYDALAAEVGLVRDEGGGRKDEAEPSPLIPHPSSLIPHPSSLALRAELDGLVAHLYELSEAELTHILGSFPLVAEAQKEAVLTAYRSFAPHPDDEIRDEGRGKREEG